MQEIIEKLKAIISEYDSKNTANDEIQVGDFVISPDKETVILVTEWGIGNSTFSGVVIKGSNKSYNDHIGAYSTTWFKPAFMRYTDIEIIFSKL